LREFASRGISALLLESEMDLGEGTSKANSAIRHTGFDSRPGTMESRMLRRAAELWPAALDQLGVPFLALGALMLARTPDERGRLIQDVAANAATLGVSTELLDRAALRDLAPYLADDVIAALLIPDEGVIDPFWLTRAYAEAAMAGGAEIRLGQAVIGLEPGDDAVTVRLADGSTLLAEQVVDAAGLRADELAALAGDRSFAITPRKGQFLVSEETFGVDRIVVPLPSSVGKGILVTPIVFGGLLLGPTAVDGANKDDRSTDPAEGDRILDACRSMVPSLADAIPVRQFAGLRSVSSTRDFIVRPSDTCDRLYFAAGIRSTGISTSPAVAETVAAEVIGLRGWGESGPLRRLAAPAFELPDAPGEIVCLCRSISRGRSFPPVANRRLPGRSMPSSAEAAQPSATARATCAASTWPGSSRANDPFRSPRWRSTVAVRGSGRLPVMACRWLVTGLANRSPCPGRRCRGDRAGTAGRAAAAAAADAGASVVLVDWRAGAAVIGLSPDRAGGWLVLVQLATGSTEVRAPAVIVATGAYLEPREHRAIAGGRPAGVMTGEPRLAARPERPAPGKPRGPAWRRRRRR
jgi:glycerol-3-phosphate dehydrogenase